MTSSASLASRLTDIRSEIENPRVGLPEEVFLFISQLTPMVNVDLLIRNPQGQSLLTWREDELYGPGWHVPGGIVRFKERLETRIQHVARKELDASVMADEQPLAMHQIMAPNRDVRGHFISFLYRCTLASPPSPDKQYRSGSLRHAQWMWHDRCPENLIPQHEIYRPYLLCSGSDRDVYV